MNLRSEKGSSYGGLIPFLFMLGAFPFVCIAAVLLGRNLRKYQQSSAEEREALPWWPRQYVTVALGIFGLWMSLLILGMFLSVAAPETMARLPAYKVPEALFSVVIGYLPVLFFLVGTPVMLVQWRRKLKEPTLLKIWALNLGLVFFGLLYLAIGYAKLHG